MSVMVTSPSFAYSTMLRTTSETAVAITVRLLCEKPTRDARARACWRAATTSAEDAMCRCTWFSFSVSVSSIVFLWAGRAFLELLVEEGQALLQVEGRGHVLQGQSQLDHGEGDVRLNAHNHRLCPAKFGRIGDRSERTRGKGIKHIECGHVDDDAPRAVPANQIRESVSEPKQVLVAERRLDAGDQIAALFENWNVHVLPNLVMSAPRRRTAQTARPNGCAMRRLRPAPPCSPAGARRARYHPANRRRYSSCPARRRL